MNAVSRISRLQEGFVDRTKKHFELFYEPAKGSGSDESMPVAAVGPPIDGVVSLQFLIEAGDPKNAEVVSNVKQELRFYLIDTREPNPWAYAIYHCGTASNVYSKVHWAFRNSAGEGVHKRKA